MQPLGRFVLTRVAAAFAVVLILGARAWQVLPPMPRVLETRCEGCGGQLVQDLEPFDVGAEPDRHMPALAPGRYLGWRCPCGRARIVQRIEERRE